jgi:hypothetical protein
MGSGRKPSAKWEYAPETGREPEYYITETKYETIGNGNVRRYAYVLRNNELHLVHTEIIPADALILMGRKAMQIGSDAFNLDQWDQDRTEH